MNREPGNRREERSKRARGDMKRLDEQSEKLFGAGSAPPPDGETEDPIELWGRRIGRTLGYLIGAGLLVYLLATYVFRAGA